MRVPAFTENAALACPSPCARATQPEKTAPLELLFLGRYPGGFASELATREIGVQFNSADGVWHFLADVYRTTFTNEIFNRPPPLLPIYLGPSRRDGFDVEVRVRVYKDGGRALSLFANYSEIDGELVGRATGTSIPDVAEYFVKYGFDLAWPLNDAAQVITFSAAQVWEGPKPLNATNTLSTKTFSRIDAKFAYTNRNWKGFAAYLGFISYPDRVLEERVHLRHARHRGRFAQVPVNGARGRVHSVLIDGSCRRRRGVLRMRATMASGSLVATMTQVIAGLLECSLRPH